MKKVLFISSLFIFTLNASVSQGKEIYKKECLQCHLGGKALASNKPSVTWKELFVFQNGTNTLAQIHLKIHKAEPSWTYFEGEGYKEESKHLKDLMLKYSSDRGSHNSCN